YYSTKFSSFCQAPIFQFYTYLLHFSAEYAIIKAFDFVSLSDTKVPHRKEGMPMEIETQLVSEGDTLVEISHIQCGKPQLIKGIANAAACRASMSYSPFYEKNGNIQFHLRDGDNEAFWQIFNEYLQQLDLVS
ncbi:MAG: hypothetical protein Q4F60_02555, partial [Candidatus Saccharibacteria bacterium]|nr:hypothetical protein [Candidatus Saccharibacteria bacterium]